MTDQEIALLATQGWFCREACVEALQAEAAAWQRVATRQLKAASVSRHHTEDATVRGDATQWLSPSDVDVAPLWTMFEALRLEMNEGAWLGLARFELQLAHYLGEGEGYARHRDAFAGPEGRRLTAIVYLNPRWQSSDGGELRLYVTPVIDMAPLMGRLVVFRSAHVEHEVLRTWAPRLAVTAWYYG